MITISIFILVVCCFLCLYRIIVGPESPDRFISLITLTMLSVAFMSIYSFIYKSNFLIDITLDAFILVFVGAVAVGKYLSGKELDE
ncbi:MAG: monovalent cation/H+ antiporter complex subunit F [Elusimicrobiota bacterium]